LTLRRRAVESELARHEADQRKSGVASGMSPMRASRVRRGGNVIDNRGIFGIYPLALHLSTIRLRDPPAGDIFLRHRVFEIFDGVATACVFQDGTNQFFA